MDPFVQWLRPNFFNVLIRVRTPYGLYRGYSLIGKTAILHIVNLGSSPDVSISQMKLAVPIFIIVIIDYYRLFISSSRSSIG